jgi:hypothetical protein
LRLLSPKKYIKSVLRRRLTNDILGTITRKERRRRRRRRRRGSGKMCNGDAATINVHQGDDGAGRAAELRLGK